ncbi:MAG: ImmA/IrrE family metallo-endopeptidase [Emcibacteraceae bacterium]|nr:ImmA/IrrE family metallo-endopeptidase [Emcibacteraceae bacterium]
MEFPQFKLEEYFESVSLSPGLPHKAEIEKITLNLRDHLGLGRGPISNMVRVLETNGVIVSTAKDISSKVDAFCNDDVIPIVMRNDSKSSVRCRFDLAHELGHLIMHKGVTNCIDENPQIEKQANHFASCFLLPKETFIAEFPFFTKRRIPWDKLYELKFRWKVSVAAIIMRGHELGLIDDAARQKAFMHISHRGWRTCEEGDKLDNLNYIELEQPELLRNAVNLLKNSDPDFLPSMRQNIKFSARVLKAILGMEELLDSEFEKQKSVLRLVK